MKELITKKGYDNLKKELDYLKITRRNELKETLRFATELGDLRENAEYDAALMEYEEIESKIYKLERSLNNCLIIDDSNNYKVNVGSTVKLLFDDGTKDDYMIVGPSEVDPTNNKISYLSEVGKVLIDSKIGDTLEVNSNNYKYNITVIEIC